MVVLNLATKPDPDFKHLQLSPTEYQDYFKFGTSSFSKHLYEDYRKANSRNSKGNYCDKEVITKDGYKIQMHSSVYEDNVIWMKGDNVATSIMEPYIDSLYLDEDEFIKKYVENGKTGIPIFGLLKYAHKQGNSYLESICIKMICMLQLGPIDIENIRKINESIQTLHLTRFCEAWEAKNGKV